jgi:hypothetical protein
MKYLEAMQRFIRLIWNEKWRHYDKGLVTKKFIPTIDYRLEIKKKL